MNIEVNKGNFTLPTVTRILNLVKPESSIRALQKWQTENINKLGPEGFSEMSKKILVDGTQIHSCIEEMLKNKKSLNEMNLDSYNDEVLNSLKTFDKIFKNNISKVLTLEGPVHHPNLMYSGVLDCLAYYDDRLVLIDWKSSLKSKPSIRDLYDWPKQLVAYLGAYMYDPAYAKLRKKHKLEGMIIINVNRNNGQEDVHSFNFDQTELYWEAWLESLEKFWLIIHENNKPKN
jgi:mitochondrial genome maintenance exonuclease 1